MKRVYINISNVLKNPRSRFSIFEWCQIMIFLNQKIWITIWYIKIGVFCSPEFIKIINFAKNCLLVHYGHHEEKIGFSNFLISVVPNFITYYFSKLYLLVESSSLLKNCIIFINWTKTFDCEMIIVILSYIYIFKFFYFTVNTSLTTNQRVLLFLEFVA